MAEIFVTVGMSGYPFDRLTAALAGLAREHEVFAQIGAGRIVPPCPWERYLPMATVMDKIASADVVVTHAGNTVRLVQRQGKVPIAVARQARFGEMNNDHQVEYLRVEEGAGPVVAVWDVSTLSEVVRDHDERQARLLLERPAPPAADPEQIRQVMGGVVDEILSRPRGGWLRPRRSHAGAEGPTRGRETQ